MKLFKTNHLRKFWVAILTVLSASILCGLQVLNGGEYTAIVTSVVALFKMANRLEKLEEKAQ